MHSTLLKRFLNSCSDNRKSKTCGERSRTIQNRKWVGVVALVVAFAMCGAVATAQQPKKVPRIGYLSQYDAAAESARFEPFRRALRELGYIEGQNIAIEFRGGERKPDRLTALAAELVRLKVDIIVVPTESRIFRRPRMRPRRFPSLCWPFRRILLRQVWLKALLVPAATSPALQPFLES